jgi:hypothetical protein
MLNRIFPKKIDNNFRGHWLAIWLLVPIVVARLLIGVNSILNTRSVSLSAASAKAGSAVVFKLLALALVGFVPSLLNKSDFRLWPVREGAPQ